MDRTSSDRDIFNSDLGPPGDNNDNDNDDDDCGVTYDCLRYLLSF